MQVLLTHCQYTCIDLVFRLSHRLVKKRHWLGHHSPNKRRPRLVKQITKKLPLGRSRVSQSFACYSCCDCVVTAHTEIPCSKLDSRLSFHALFAEGMFDERHFSYEVSPIAQLLWCTSPSQDDMRIGWFLCQAC